VQQRDLRLGMQAERSAMFDGRRMLHGRVHDGHLRHGKLSIRWFVVSELLAAELLSAIRGMPGAIGVHAKGDVLPHLRCRRRQFAPVLRSMLADKRGHELAALCWSELWVGLSVSMASCPVLV